MLKELQNKYNSANIIIIILNILFVYAICNKLEYFVINNIIHNNIMLKTITKKFKEINNIYYNLIKYCFCYINYIINLFI
jgi:hypothetical protein